PVSPRPCWSRRLPCASQCERAMDVVLIMVILAAVAVFVTAPLRRAPASLVLAEEEDAGLGELEAARDAKLRELRDAELDHRTGKLSDADYASIDATLRA